MATIWDELGVGPGSHEATIRRAYARRLKTTQPEDDPEGFKRLREAYDQALKIARRPQPQSNPGMAAQATVARPDDAAPLMPTAEEDAAVPYRRALDADAKALVAGLQSSDPSQWAEARRSQADMLGSPLLDDLALRASIELWMAHQIASRIPRADGLIEPAAHFFGWDAGSYRQLPPSVAAVLARREDIEFVAALADPEHEGHRGWRALTERGVPNWRRQIEALRPGTRTWVAVLLGKMRTTHPGLRFDVDKEAATWWHRRLAPSKLEAVAWRVPITLVLSLLATLAVSVMMGDLLPLAWLGMSVAVAVVLAAAQALSVRPSLTLWMRRNPRVADDRWWIGALAALPLLGWALPLTPAMLLALTGFAGATLAWQDASLAVAPATPGQRPKLWQIVAALVWLAVIGVGTASTLGLPRIYPWLAVSLPFILMWVRGIRPLTLRLARVPLGMRRAAAVAFLLVELGISLSATLHHDRMMHFGSALLAGPLLLLLNQTLRLEPPEWRQRLNIPSRVLLVGLLLAILHWVPPAAVNGTYIATY